VVVGERGMLVWDDLARQDKLVYHEKSVDPATLAALGGKAEPVMFEEAEPLRRECAHFLNCVAERTPPRSDGHDGLRVVEVLERATQSLAEGRLSSPARHRNPPQHVSRKGESSS
jgi:UDP-2-acetamido-3-amino-2,3-dideoxy-glucuronate N-acetyltransferase